MVSTPKTAGLALFSLALAARYATAVDNCPDLITAASSGTETITIETDFSCSDQIEIAASQTVTITGSATISIAAGYASDTSLFVNDGTLTLEGLTIVSSAAVGVRAVRNTGTLTVDGCSFTGLNGSGGEGTILDQGGVIYSASTGTIEIIDSTFSSNVAKSRGGAIFAGDGETLIITGSTFSLNDADSFTGDEPAAGGSVWANTNVELTVTDSVFSTSTAEYGGGAIECCGGTFTSSNFSSIDSSLSTEHFGAVLVGRPGVGCPYELTMTGCTFDGCSVDHTAGAGGSLAIFDTSATIESCVFQNSVGTALLFESSSATGDHKLSMSSNEFNENTNPSELYITDEEQGTAVVVTNTGLEEGDEPVPMGEFYNMFCYYNVPYECEFIEDLAEIDYSGDFKCHVCNIDGVRQLDTTEDDDLDGSAEQNSSDSGSSSDSSGIVIGLSLALGLTLVVIGALAAYKFRARKSARRLMEDMGDGDL
ncbi:unnamed protein product [Scytosiphon promiscuus]